VATITKALVGDYRAEHLSIGIISAARWSATA
jgi:hypothetical protein